MKNFLLLIFVAFVVCNPVNNTSRYIQPADLIGTWSVTHSSMQRCIFNGDTLAPDTCVIQSTYQFTCDSVTIRNGQILRSPCGIIPLPIVFGITSSWKIHQDTLLIFPVTSSSEIIFDSAVGQTLTVQRILLSRYSTDKIIFASLQSIDTCSKQ